MLGIPLNYQILLCLALVASSQNLLVISQALGLALAALIQQALVKVYFHGVTRPQLHLQLLHFLEQQRQMYLLPIRLVHLVVV